MRMPMITAMAALALAACSNGEAATDEAEEETVETEVSETAQASDGPVIPKGEPAEAEAPAASASADRLAVPIGEVDPNLDACLSVGQVVNLNPAGDNFLSVRARPSTDAAELDRLRPGDFAHICTGQGEGDWFGIVYERSGNDGPGNCGTGSPVPSPRGYDGPCRSGWVSTRYMDIIAG